MQKMFFIIDIFCCQLWRVKRLLEQCTEKIATGWSLANSGEYAPATTELLNNCAYEKGSARTEPVSLSICLTKSLSSAGQDFEPESFSQTALDTTYIVGKSQLFAGKKCNRTKDLLSKQSRAASDKDVTEQRAANSKYSKSNPFGGIWLSDFDGQLLPTNSQYDQKNSQSTAYKSSITPRLQGVLTSMPSFDDEDEQPAAAIKPSAFKNEMCTLPHLTGAHNASKILKPDGSATKAENVYLPCIVQDEKGREGLAGS